MSLNVLYYLIMRNVIAIGMCFCTSFALAQNKHDDSLQLQTINPPNLDSLERALSARDNDTSKANLLGILSYQYAFIQAEKAVVYGQEGIKLSRKLGYTKGVALCSQSLSMAWWGVGNYSNGLASGLNALHLFEELKDEENVAFTYYVLACVYRDFGDYQRALADAHKGLQIYASHRTNDIIGPAIIGSIFELMNQIDSASFYLRTAFQLDKKLNNGQWGWLYYLQGNIHRKQKEYDSAMYYYRAALPLVKNKDIVETYNGMAILFQETGKIDSSIYYASEVLEKWRFVYYQRGILQAAKILADVYMKTDQRDSTIKYLQLSMVLNNILYNQTVEREIQMTAFNEQLRRDEIARERERNANRLIMYTVVAAGILFLAVALLLWRNNKHKQKAKEKIEQAYGELKSTQQQLIQSEKMASLGELTAGIAHEIQNPLNFVNNFSELNKELLAEMKDQIESRDFDEASAIANDIIENEEKINHHGRRADAIVKGMLQHSRRSTGVKEPTDINALIDEYLRLAYHGFRAKDKSFNATMKTEFDPSVGKVDVIPQDIGRAILNLITNAFYAANERRKQGAENFEPTVLVVTKKINNAVQITVRDNGNGIPSHVIEKIFQPFFTTKPTGQGTGLGLSMSYDIITKTHGGELKVTTREGEYAEFQIILPA